MNKLVKEILAKRGLKEQKEIEAFLNPDYDKLADPFLLPDMNLAVERIVRAVNAGEQIAVYGDYDVDGTVASALLLEALECFGAENVMSYIPDRFSEGYGLNEVAIKKLANDQVDLIITVDCGSLSHLEIELANKLGVDVVVTDHHDVAKVRPPAVAVVNPRYGDSKKIFSDYCGAGVVFQLVRALQTRLSGLSPGQEKWFLDLVALGTVSDIVPLAEDNRTLVYWGLKVLAKTRRPGLKALMAVARVNPKQVCARSIGFVLGPRLNAAGRLETAKLALSLLRTEDNAEALSLAEKLDGLNLERRKEQNGIFEQVCDKLAGCEDEVLVISSRGWSHGIVGIVASKVVEALGKPVFILEELDDGTAKGSGRSFGDFKLGEAVAATSKWLIKCGGHDAAAGVTIETVKLPEWRKAINEYYKDLGLKNQAAHLRVREDVEIESLSELTVELARDLEVLEPFGLANERPIFKLKNQAAKFVDKIGKESNHLKLTIIDKGQTELKLLAFEPPKEWFVEPGDKIDLWVNLEINEWRGNETVEGRILSINRK
ncbi:single-stranded-DNA-specific exonuclease RecJ [Candidatus Saccharibacteria bacterium]|nr:single-stranded-DNA-specific exonuclease RecJ [Candidatus Saccharibacteria bacterium]